MPHELTPHEESELKKCEVIIAKTQGAFVECGLAIARIRDAKLYRRDFDTFEEYCEKRWEWTRQRAYQLIEAAEVAASLGNVKHALQNTRQATALASVPAEKRKEVLEKAAKSGRVTAKSIARAAVEPDMGPEPEMSPIGDKSKEEEPVIELDKTGYAIPESIMEDWRRAEGVKDLLSQVSDVRCTLKTGLDGGDVIYKEVNNTTLAALSDAYTGLKQVVPFAVCPTCAGHQRKKCTLCRGRGFLSEFTWKQCVPIEIKEIRKKVGKK